MRDNVTQSTQSTSAQSARRRNPAYGVLIGIILLTIPCYLIGFAALYILQRNVPGVSAPTPTITPSTAATNAPTATLGALLPTAFVPPTTAAVLTPVPPTQTPPPTPFGTVPPATVVTLAPTLTDTPSPTPTLYIPSATPTLVPFIPVDTPTPTATATSTEVPTLEAPTAIAPAP